MKISKKKAVLLLLFSIFTIGAAGCEKKEAKLGEETAAAESSIPEDGNLKDSSSDMTKEQAAIETSELAETEETDESEGESVNGDTYLLPGSDQEYVTPEDLADMDQERLQLARNEIYARHGRRFQTAEIQEYFDSMPWYEGRIEPEDFQEEMLTPLEQINVSYLKSWEEELDGRAPKDTWFFKIISRLKAAPEYELYLDTMKDCGDYYQVDARIWQVNYVPLKEYESAGDGGKVNMVVDEFTGQTEEILLNKGENKRNWDFPIDLKRGGYQVEDRLHVMYYEDGGQRSTTPSCGTRLFIRKDALLLHYPMTEEVTVTPDTITTLYSDISFDGDGFVTRMESMYP